MYGIQIAFVEKYQDESGEQLRPRVIVLDAVDDTNVTASNTITDHPIVSGDMVADHSFKNPQRMTITGSASSFGHKGIVVDSNEISLADLEELFMTIKNEGYMCTIFKLSTTDETDVRFSVRENMVLENIRLTEKISSLSYTLEFRQVLVATVLPTDVDVDDAFLPNVNEPTVTSFTDALIDWDTVDALAIKVVHDNGLMTKEFTSYLRSMGKEMLLGIGVSLAVAVAVTAGFKLAFTLVGVGAVAVASQVGALTAISQTWLAVTPQIALGIAAAIALAAIVVTTVKAIKLSKFNVKEFKAYRDAKKTNQEVKRFCSMIEEFHNHVEQLNKDILVYQIGSNDDQEIPLQVDNTYYVFTFTKNNTSGAVKCVITDFEEAITSSIQDVFSCPTSYADCTSGNKLFETPSGWWGYLINLNEPGQRDLTKCLICISKIDPSSFNNVVSDIIYNALTK